MDRQDPKDAMDEIPWHLPMDIEPDRGCSHCGCRKWSETIVDTSKRYDLFTNAEIHNWQARTDCLICGEIFYWDVDPDGATRERGGV